MTNQSNKYSFLKITLVVVSALASILAIVFGFDLYQKSSLVYNIADKFNSSADHSEDKQEMLFLMISGIIQVVGACACAAGTFALFKSSKAAWILLTASVLILVVSSILSTKAYAPAFAGVYALVAGFAYWEHRKSTAVI